MGDAGRIAVEKRRHEPVDGGGLVTPQEEVGQYDRDERVRDAIDGCPVFVRPGGPRLPPGRVVPDGPDQGPDEDRDAREPQDGADDTDGPRNGVQRRRRQTRHPQGGKRELHGRRPRGGEGAIEVCRNERVGLPEDDVEDEPVEPEDDLDLAGDSDEKAGLPEEQPTDSGGHVSPSPGRYLAGSH